MKIFHFESDVGNHSSFIEDYPQGQESIIGRAMTQSWQPFNDDFQPVVLKLRANDDGKKNYKFDFSSALGPFMVFSEKAVDDLGVLLLEHGQILPVITESKQKKFVGYYPLHPVSHCIDMEKSQYRKYENGLMIRKPVLVGKNLPDQDLFVLEEDISRVFVTERFKKRVEECGLQAFDFSAEVDVF